MSRDILIGIAFLLIAPAGLAAVDKDGYDEYTIRPPDVPADAPRFEDYPAEMYRGPNAAFDLLSHPTSRLFRTMLAKWAQAKPNFAGHFILADWGCGTDCTQIAIIDARTGKIFHPPGATFNVGVNVHHALLEPTANIEQAWYSTGTIRYRENSRLLVLIGMPEGRVENRGISYYVWEETSLTRIRFIPTRWHPQNR